MKDPIIDELWKAKDRIAQEYDYDLDKLAAELIEKEKQLQVTDLSKSNRVRK